MPRKCTICAHDQREAIDQAIVAGAPLRRIAADHSLSESAMHRHAKKHLPAKMSKAAAVQEVAEADDLVATVRTQQKRVDALFGAAVEILKSARDEKDHGRVLQAINTAVRAQREASRKTELLARLAGELQGGTTVQVAVLTQSPEWHALRARLLAALEDHPAARLAVSQALLEAGDGVVEVA
jgi:hypothetical protein